jgi:HEAT repeat protein
VIQRRGHMRVSVGSGNEAVRSWAAEALGEFRFEPAVPALRRLLRERKAAGDPPTHSDSSNTRWALSELGAHNPSRRRVCTSC